MIKYYSYGKYGHYAKECRNKEHNEEANLMFLEDAELTLMLAEEISNRLILNKEKVMANPLIRRET